MRARQPFAEALRGGVWRVAVKGHQRSRATRYAHQVRAPSIPADRGDFDEKFTTVDDFFEPMDAHGLWGEKGRVILANVRIGSSESGNERKG
jgi:hypothetical protein